MNQTNIDILLANVKSEARQFTNENIRNPTEMDYLLTELAFKRGVEMATQFIMERSGK